VIQWDSTAEISIDTLEGGMDFLGYRIYRARRTDLDTFARDLQLNERKGPLAWKEVASFVVTPPFLKSTTTVGNTGISIDNLTIADVIKPGQRKFLVARSPNFALPWAGYWNQLLQTRNQLDQNDINADGTLKIDSLSRYDSVTCTFFTTQFDDLPSVGRAVAQNPANAW
jgi:hypothetical protein